MSRDDQDDERVVLVTGGSRGIGAATTALLAQRGRRVACTYRSGRREAERLAARWPGRVLPVPLDLADREAAATAVETTLGEWGRLDALILNAGYWAGGRLGRMDPQDWWRVVDTNLGGTVALTAAALPALRRSRSPGIVLVSSAVGLIGHAGDTAYASVKAAMVGFGRSLAKENARYGVRVNVLAPGFVETDMTSEVGDTARAHIERETVLGRFGTAEEMATAAVFLSEDATFCTGAVLAVDGGWTL